MPGHRAAPFASWARAQTAAAPGDTVYFRGGVYRYTDATSTCTSGTATVNAVVLNKSGTAGNPIRYWAYPGETPVFDFSGINDTSKYSCRQVGVRVEADWLYLKGLELTGTLQLNNLNHESWCVYVIGGSNNIFELLDAHHNMGPGFFIQEGGNNTFLNCDSHENEDTLTSNGDGQSADGFGCHPDRAGDTGNVFRGCRAWWNSDDGWDFINSQEACTVEYSWAWYNGYKPDAVSGGQPVSLAAGNGNGFKGGGYGDPQTNVPAVPPQHTIRFDCAFYNKANGLYANHEIVSPYFYDNTSFNNGTDVDMLGLNGTTVTSVGILRNNLAYSNNGHGLLADMTQRRAHQRRVQLVGREPESEGHGRGLPERRLRPARVVPRDVRRRGARAAARPPTRRALGGWRARATPTAACRSWPSCGSRRRARSIDKGTNVGLPFSGNAPDLGCFETGLVFDPSDGGASSGSSGGGASADGGGTSSVAGDGGSSGGPSTGPDAASGGTGSGGSSGGQGSSGAAGTSSGGGSADNEAAGSAGASGCSCRVTRGTDDGGESGLVALGAIAIMVAARRRRDRSAALGHLERSSWLRTPLQVQCRGCPRRALRFFRGCIVVGIATGRRCLHRRDLDAGVARVPDGAVKR